MWSSVVGTNSCTRPCWMASTSDSTFSLTAVPRQVAWIFVAASSSTKSPSASSVLSNSGFASFTASVASASSDAAVSLREPAFFSWFFFWVFVAAPALFRKGAVRASARAFTRARRTISCAEPVYSACSTYTYRPAQFLISYQAEERTQQRCSRRGGCKRKEAASVTLCLSPIRGNETEQTKDPEPTSSRKCEVFWNSRGHRF